MEWFIMENPIEMEDLGVPLFSETSRWQRLMWFCVLNKTSGFFCVYMCILFCLLKIWVFVPHSSFRFFPPIHRLVENFGKGRLESESRRLKPGGIIWSTFQTTWWISKRKQAMHQKIQRHFCWFVHLKTIKVPLKKYPSNWKNMEWYSPTFRVKKKTCSEICI